MDWEKLLKTVADEMAKERDRGQEDALTRIAFQEIIRQEYGANVEDISREVYRQVDALMRERAIRKVAREKLDVPATDYPHS